MKRALLVLAILGVTATAAQPSPDSESFVHVPLEIDCCFPEGCVRTNDARCGELLADRNAAEQTEARNWRRLETAARRDRGPMELQEVNLAYGPGARLVRVVGCIDVTATAAERSALGRRAHQLCRLEIDDICAGDAEATLADVWWPIPRLAGSPGVRGALAPLEGAVFGVTLRSRLTPDGLAIIAFTQLATQEESSCP